MSQRAGDRLTLGARSRSGSHDRFLLLLVVLIACSLAAVACLLLWRHATDSETAPLRLSVALVVLLFALIQICVARSVWRRRGQRRAEAEALSPLTILRLSFVGLVLCYTAALCIGPLPHSPYLFIAGIAGWQTLILLPLANPTSRRTCKRLAASCAVRRFAWTTYGLFVALVGAELSLRAYGWVSGGRLDAGCVVHGMTLTPGSDFHGRQVNSQGFWGPEFSREVRPGRFRVAVLGGDVTLSGTPDTNCLAQLERLVPGLEVFNFGLPQAGPRECAALAEEVFAYRPDLVLTFVSVGDLAVERSTPGPFDWRTIRLVQFVRSSCSPGTSPALDAVAVPTLSASTLSTDSSYLRQCERRLLVCHSPLDAAMQRRWQAAIAQFDDVARQCREHRVPLAIVVVPSDCQVNPLLCDTVRRRLGYEPAELDLESPQRRLAGFAEDRQLPVLDLLPCLKQAEGSPHVACAAQWNEQGNTLAAQALSRWLNGRFGAQIAAMAQANAR